MLVLNLVLKYLEDDMLGWLEPSGNESWGSSSPKKGHIRVGVAKGAKKEKYLGVNYEIN